MPRFDDFPIGRAAAIRSSADMGVDWDVGQAGATAAPSDPLGVLIAGLPGPLAVFLAMTGLLLTGYAFFGKGFAYLGVPPLYVGDATLGVGLLLVLASGRLVGAFGSPVVWLMAAFASWGVVRTIPFVGEYGMDALRDAALFGYSTYAILWAACLLSVPGAVGATVRWYARFAIPFVLWVPILWAVTYFDADRLPRTPFTDVPFAFYKAGDVAVHLAGIAALWWLELGPSGGQRVASRLWRYCRWCLWSVAFLVVLSKSRGGALSFAATLLCVAALRPAALRKLIPMAVASTVAAVMMVVAAASGAESYFTRVDTDRPMSVSQIVENLTSLGGAAANASGYLDETRQWRLDWWSVILGYTFNGDFFWGGKGFGVNLADDDGFQSPGETPLRSPHNVHMTVLARAGVPGLLLWILLHGTFAAAMARGAITAKRAAQDWWARVDVWILAYWAALLVNASFDVYLEGPQGAIWFWSLVGAGLAALHLQRQERLVALTYRLSLKSRRARVSG